ncbi:MAG: J domain-containing protein [Actinomycetota bacterium]|nr:J domain-containing protein [Actinomycetota bacterium]
MSIPRRLGRLAQGFVSNLQEDERFRERLRVSRERSEVLKSAFEAAWKGASEEWRKAEERRAAEEATAGGDGSGPRSRNRPSGRRGASTSSFIPRRYPSGVLAAYNRLDLSPGTSMDEVDRKRRELVKRFHPDRFSDPDKRARAERVTAEINAAHDAIERHILRKTR